MRIHTTLDRSQVRQALRDAQARGKVAPGVMFYTLKEHGSRSHDYAYEVQLGAFNKDSLLPGSVDQQGKPLLSRRRNTSSTAYAATWHEWGWFIAELFKLDPYAKVGQYNNAGYFHSQTDCKFEG